FPVEFAPHSIDYFLDRQSLRSSWLRRIGTDAFGRETHPIEVVVVLNADQHTKSVVVGRADAGTKLVIGPVGTSRFVDHDPRSDKVGVEVEHIGARGGRAVEEPVGVLIDPRVIDVDAEIPQDFSDTDTSSTGVGPVNAPTIGHHYVTPGVVAVVKRLIEEGTRVVAHRDRLELGAPV